MANINPPIGCSCEQHIRIFSFVCEGRPNNVECGSQLHYECFIRAKERDPARQISCVNCGWIITVSDLIDDIIRKMGWLRFVHHQLSTAVNIAENDVTEIYNINDDRNTHMFTAQNEANEARVVLNRYDDLLRNLRNFECEFFYNSVKPLLKQFLVFIFIYRN